MKTTTKQIKKRYNRFSYFYDWIETPIEKRLFSKWRKEILSNLKGKILEIGVGTGKNLKYYHYDKVDLTAIDISEGTLNRAETKAEKLNLKVNFKLINSEKLPFVSNSFDYVVATFVLCSVSNQETILKEIKRVLKPKGKIILLEHVLSKNKLIALFQHVHNPITRFIFGFNVDRDTVRSIESAGLKIVKEKDLAIKDVFKQLEVEK